ncbi:MAG: NAD(P)-binding protein [Bacteroides sp.]|nr:NAD(P)-binding protein [Bacteroides sp.]MCM1446721.1 NAD(P)-binding protein [Bacteroides sp.]
MTKVDIIVIGSGLGGLEVALTMAREGRRVMVLERQHQLGGCMQSYRRGKLRLDTGLHYVGGLEPGGQLYDAFVSHGLMDLPWRRMDMDCFEEIHIGGRIFRWPQGTKEFINAMKGYFPHEEKGLDLYNELLESTDEIWLQRTNAWEYLSSIISDPLLVQVLSAPATCKMELRKETLPLFTFIHGTAPFIQSSWRLNGDGNMIVGKLQEQIRACGGEILTDKEVVLLQENNGRIAKAVCADGTEYEADYFVSNAHPAVTCSLVGDSLLMKKVFRHRMSMQPNTVGMFTLHLQLRCGTMPYFNHNKLVFTEDNCWDMAVDKTLKVKGVMITARRPEKGDYVTNMDILTPMLWETVSGFEGSKLFHRPKAYRELKAEVARQCLEIAETAIPGLGDMVLNTWSSTPLTYKDYNLSPDGSAFGFRKDYANPMMTIVSPKTQIPNLFMTGQSLMLHGLHGVTMTAAYTCQEISRITVSE